MVRRGSTVRVRQRALKSRKTGIFVVWTGTTEHLPVLEVVDGVPLKQPSRNGANKPQSIHSRSGRKRLDDLGIGLGDR